MVIGIGSVRGLGSLGWVIGASEVRCVGGRGCRKDPKRLGGGWLGCKVRMMDIRGQERMEDGYGQESSSRRLHLLVLGEITGKPTV